MSTINLNKYKIELGFNLLSNDSKQNLWEIQLRRNNKTMEFEFWNGAQAGKPELNDVVYCLLADKGTLDYADNFQDWAEGLGYNPDSITDLNTFNQIKVNTDKLRTLFTDQELTELSIMFENY